MPKPTKEWFFVHLDYVVIIALMALCLMCSILLFSETPDRQVEDKEGKKKSAIAVYGYVGILLLILSLGLGILYIVVKKQKKLQLVMSVVADSTQKIGDLATTR